MAGANMKTAAMILVAGLATMAQTAEPGTLTLACTGTTVAGYEGANPEPTSMGLIVSFTAGMVHGFGAPGWMDYPVKITGINEVTVTFGGDGHVGSQAWGIIGSIDRVTGDVQATETAVDTKTGKMF